MYAIRAVAKKTGLSQHVIRAWERRYQAVVPKRTDTNRRVYSDEDVERLLLLRRATQAGHSIGNIARLPNERLIELVLGVSRDILSASKAGFEAEEQPSKPTPAVLVHRCLDAIRRSDVVAIETLLTQAAITRSQTEFLDRILTPLLCQIGELWEVGSLNIAQEHLATTIIRDMLERMLDTLRSPLDAPVFLVTTPMNQWHELGALMAAVVAASQGWSAVYLGPNLPATELGFAVCEHRARAVALSLVYPESDPAIEEELRVARECVPQEIAMLVGGRASISYEPTLEIIGAICVRDLPGLRRTLHALGENGHD